MLGMCSILLICWAKESYRTPLALQAIDKLPPLLLDSKMLLLYTSHAYVFKHSEIDLVSN